MKGGTFYMNTNDENILEKITYFLDNHKIFLYLIPVILGIFGVLVIKILNDIMIRICFL